MPGVQCFCNDYDMVHKRHRKILLQGSQHRPRTCKQNKYLLHSLIQVVIIINQQADMMLQRYTKHHLSYSSHA